MISLDVKPKSSSPLTAVLNGTDEKSTPSFSQLLKGVKLQGTNKEIQNGVFVLSLDKNTKEIPETKLSKAVNKTDTLLSLLKNDKEPLILNPELTKALTPKDLKVLIKNAKEYLKEKIQKSPEYIKSQAKELPKTLKGLVTLAKNFGIDVNKITLENGQTKNLLNTPVEHKEQVKVQTKAELKNDEVNLKEQAKIDTQLKDIPKEIKSAPLFKALTQKEHTTEQIVQTKIVVKEHKTPKTKANDTLKLLLRGEKVVKSDTRLTADFSVSTAKVIAPVATTEAHKSLESLLKGDKNSSDTPDVKLDGLTTLKADSFEVKLGEAKQMIKYLSQDVKTAIENYKSPFTRVKVQLNPQKLGEVDVTIVQRGKNLHINLSSNNTAINTLAMNSNDLKAQLNSNGINNATLNFNNNSQGEQNANAGHQNQQQHRQKANEEYNYFENQESNEEVLNSLEIVVTRYA